MAQSTESLRQELLAARGNIRRQIDKLRASPNPYPFYPDGPANNVDAIAKLTETLHEIEDSLADLESDGP